MSSVDVRGPLVASSRMIARPILLVRASMAACLSSLQGDGGRITAGTEQSCRTASPPLAEPCQHRRRVELNPTIYCKRGLFQRADDRQERGFVMDDLSVELNELLTQMLEDEIEQIRAKPVHW